jgi:hypothetical protein
VTPASPTWGRLAQPPFLGVLELLLDVPRRSRQPVGFPAGVGQCAGQVLDVPPGPALESTIGLANLSPLSGAELDSCQQGSAGAVSN